MKTGASETSRESAPNENERTSDSFDKFDEHERDTARRAYPKEIVDGIKRTTKMPKLDLAKLQTESGTRPALTHDAIERHVREQMADALAEVEHASGGEIDPHSRPTIAAGIPDTVPPKREGEWPPDSLAASTPLPRESGSVPRPAALATASSAPDASPIPAWVVGVILAGLFLIVSAAGTVGFFLGRRSVRP